MPSIRGYEAVAQDRPRRRSQFVAAGAADQRRFEVNRMQEPDRTGGYLLDEGFYDPEGWIIGTVGTFPPPIWSPTSTAGWACPKGGIDAVALAIRKGLVRRGC
jgi:hypothetical protein